MIKHRLSPKNVSASLLSWTSSNSETLCLFFNRSLLSCFNRFGQNEHQNLMVVAGGFCVATEGSGVTVVCGVAGGGGVNTGGGGVTIGCGVAT